MALTRTALNALIAALVDDSGDDESGTVVFKANVDAWFDALADAVDAMMGDWTVVSFNAANFAGNGSQTWTLASGDQVAFQYRIHNNSMLVAFNLLTCSVGGTPNTELRITIPASKVCTRVTNNAFHYLDNGTKGVGLIEVNASGTQLRLIKLDFSNWTASTNLTDVRGEIEFPIN